MESESWVAYISCVWVGRGGLAWMYRVTHRDAARSHLPWRDDHAEFDAKFMSNQPQVCYESFLMIHLFLRLFNLKF